MGSPGLVDSIIRALRFTSNVAAGSLRERVGDVVMVICTLARLGSIVGVFATEDILTVVRL